MMGSDEIDRSGPDAMLASKSIETDELREGLATDAIIGSDIDQNSPEQDADKGIIVNAQDMTVDMIPTTKKKKSRSSKSKKAYKHGEGKPTGFEDSFADAPMTPEQYAEIKVAFNPRILRAIQRFERTRKMSSERHNVFYKYLSYGGIDIGPNMFQGQQDMEGREKDDIAATLAQTHISQAMRADIFDPKAKFVVQSSTSNTGRDCSWLTNGGMDYSKQQKSDQENDIYKYVIDFRTTLCAFLSRRAPAAIAMETKEGVDLVTTTLERFMDYLLQNEACPEYLDEVLQSRDLCREAREEMWACVLAQKNLPGDFNIACSTLFGGVYERDYDGQTYWGEAGPGTNVFVGLTPEKASQVVGFAIAAAAEGAVYQKYANMVENGGTFEVVSTIQDHGFEITRIERATDLVKDLYRANTDELRPVGKVLAKFWRNPEALPEDLTPEERESSLERPVYDSTRRDMTYPGDNLTFYLEDSTILPYLEVGQKVECTMHELDCGVWFFDEVIRLYPSFDVWIENELTYDRKEPRIPARTHGQGAPINEGGAPEPALEGLRQEQQRVNTVTGDVDEPAAYAEEGRPGPTSDDEPY